MRREDAAGVRLREREAPTGHAGLGAVRGGELLVALHRDRLGLRAVERDHVERRADRVRDEARLPSLETTMLRGSRPTRESPCARRYARRGRRRSDPSPDVATSDSSSGVSARPMGSAGMSIVASTWSFESLVPPPRRTTSLLASRTLATSRPSASMTSCAGAPPGSEGGNALGLDVDHADERRVLVGDVATRLPSTFARSTGARGGGREALDLAAGGSGGGGSAAGRTTEAGRGVRPAVFSTTRASGRAHAATPAMTMIPSRHIDAASPPKTPFAGGLFNATQDLRDRNDAAP